MIHRLTRRLCRCSRFCWLRWSRPRPSRRCSSPVSTASSSTPQSARRQRYRHHLRPARPRRSAARRPTRAGASSSPTSRRAATGSPWMASAPRRRRCRSRWRTACPSSVTLRLPPAFRDAVVVEGARPAPSIATRTSLGAESIARTPGRAGARRLQDVVATLPGWATEDNGLLHSRGVDDGFLYVVDGVPVYERLDQTSGLAPDAVDDRRPHRRHRLRAAGVRLQGRRRHRRADARGDRDVARLRRRPPPAATPRPTAADRRAARLGAARRSGCRRAASDRRASSIRSIPTTSTTRAAA